MKINKYYAIDSEWNQLICFQRLAALIFLWQFYLINL